MNTYPPEAPDSAKVAGYLNENELPGAVNVFGPDDELSLLSSRMTNQYTAAARTSPTTVRTTIGLMGERDSRRWFTPRTLPEERFQTWAIRQVVRFDRFPCSHVVEGGSHPLHRYADQLGPSQSVDGQLQRIGLVAAGLPVDYQPVIPVGVDGVDATADDAVTEHQRERGLDLVRDPVGERALFEVCDQRREVGAVGNAEVGATRQL